MPTYEYACRACGEHLEVVQSFSDDPLTVCEGCGGELRKVFSAAGLIFKGSGWHVKDYSSTAKPSAGSSGGSDGGSDGGSSGGSDGSAPRTKDGAAPSSTPASTPPSTPPSTAASTAKSGD